MNYVISLSSAKERRKHISEEFGRQSIGFKFFDAIEPYQLADCESKYGISLKDSGLTSGEKACFFSHIELWNKAIENNLSFIAIFEDDIFLGKNAQLFLNNYDWIPQNYDILKLEMFYHFVLMDFNKFPLLNKRYLRTLKKRHLGTAGYILSLEGAKSYLSFIKNHPIKNPLDHIMFEDYLNQGELKVSQMVPAICVQADRVGSDKFKSQLEKERVIKRSKISNVKQKLFFTEKFKREIKRLIVKVKIRFCKIRFE